MLTLTAFVWGGAFVAQSQGTNHVGGFTFNCCRFLLGGLVLIPCILLLRQLNRKQGDRLSCEEEAAGRKNAVLGGVCSGVIFCLASNLQQFGIAHTTVGKAGFITSLYIVIVPLLGIFLKKRIAPHIWLSVLVAAAGMYLLCITEGFAIGRGDILISLSAVGFSLHILCIDHFSPRADGLMLSCVQFFTAGLISCVLMLLFEKPSWQGIAGAAAPILYAGFLSCGLGYTLQIIAQKDIDPARASLIMSLESVFSLLAGWVLLKETLSARELWGCALVFGAIILAQLPVGKGKMGAPAKEKG